MSQTYSVILVTLFTLFISFYFFPVIIIFFFVFCLLWLTSYYVVHAYCVVCTIIWVGGVDVYAMWAVHCLSALVS